MVVSVVIFKILMFLFDQLICETFWPQDPMQVAAGEPAPEPSEGLGDVLEKFANTVTEKIIRSIASAMAAPGVEAGASGFAQPWETLAEDLALAAVEVALMEVSGSERSEAVFQRSGLEMDGAAKAPISQSGRISASPDLDPSHKTQIPDDSQRSPLSQLGLPTVGSLDYPDAPPTTPLFHELETSRSSFARKLKGGLAKVFLPSPPPPTPKDGEHDRAGADLDPQAELMEHLMKSLTMWAPYEERPHGGAKMEALAEALSCDIIEQVLRPGQQRAHHPLNDLHLQAHRLAENILASSLEEARMLV